MSKDAYPLAFDQDEVYRAWKKGKVPSHPHRHMGWGNRMQANIEESFIDREISRLTPHPEQTLLEWTKEDMHALIQHARRNLLDIESRRRLRAFVSVTWGEKMLNERNMLDRQTLLSSRVTPSAPFSLYDADPDYKYGEWFEISVDPMPASGTPQNLLLHHNTLGQGDATRHETAVGLALEKVRSMGCPHFHTVLGEGVFDLAGLREGTMATTPRVDALPRRMTIYLPLPADALPLDTWLSRMPDFSDVLAVLFQLLLALQLVRDQLDFSHNYLKNGMISKSIFVVPAHKENGEFHYRSFMYALSDKTRYLRSRWCVIITDFTRATCKLDGEHVGPIQRSARMDGHQELPYSMRDLAAILSSINYASDTLTWANLFFRTPMQQFAQIRVEDIRRDRYKPRLAVEDESILWRNVVFGALLPLKEFRIPKVQTFLQERVYPTRMDILPETAIERIIERTEEKIPGYKEPIVEEYYSETKQPDPFMNAKFYRTREADPLERSYKHLIATMSEFDFPPLTPSDQSLLQKELALLEEEEKALNASVHTYYREAIKRAQTRKERTIGEIESWLSELDSDIVQVDQPLHQIKSDLLRACLVLAQRIRLMKENI